MTQIPGHLPPEQAFMEILRRLHGRWRWVIMLPPVYILVGVLLNRFLFEPRWGGNGFLPLPEVLYLAGWFLGGLLVVILWRLLSVQERRQFRALSAVREDREAFLERAGQHQLLRFATCDMASLPGIALFLLQGDLLPLAVFCIISLVFYLRTMPSGRKLGEAMFQSGTNAQQSGQD